MAIGGSGSIAETVDLWYVCDMQFLDSVTLVLWHVRDVLFPGCDVDVFRRVC
jgi:hypothetical protein